jgi:hypothetical protein
MRVLTAIVLWIISEMAVAGPLEEANSAYDKGDFGLARNFHTDLAVQGDGVRYDEGKGVANDSRGATRWYIVASAHSSRTKHLSGALSLLCRLIWQKQILGRSTLHNIRSRNIFGA